MKRRLICGDGSLKLKDKDFEKAFEGALSFEDYRYV